MTDYLGWGVLWRECNRLDGKRERLIGRYGWGEPEPATHLAGHKVGFFESRQKAREFIKREFGYIASRPDLRREPHGWKMPQALKVAVTIEPIK